MISKTEKTAMLTCFMALLSAVALGQADVSGPLESRMFELTYANATEVAANINRNMGWQIVTNGCRHVGEIAVPFAVENAVMVTAPSNILESCAKMIKRIDRKPKQLYVEARFVELNNNAMFTLGLDWESLSELGVNGSAGYGISRQKIPDNISEYEQSYNTRTSGASERYKFSKGGTSDNSFFSGTLSTDQMRLVLRAFEGSADVKTFSNPKVIVTSGKEAIVDMTTKRPNVTVSAKRVLNGANNTLDVDAKMTEIPGRDDLMFAQLGRVAQRVAARDDEWTHKRGNRADDKLDIRKREGRSRRRSGRISDVRVSYNRHSAHSDRIYAEGRPDGCHRRSFKDDRKGHRRRHPVPEGHSVDWRQAVRRKGQDQGTARNHSVRYGRTFRPRKRCSRRGVAEERRSWARLH